ncbi:hypothetical protein [Leifsonia poae]|uniref:hypothetical protein n=1 Tax=Leifsonia poae TaxID=110933 RepID=UPI003D678EC2
MELSVEYPLDSDGFLRRECPTCEREFKWHHGPTEEAPSDFVYPDVYWCPRCGKSAGHDSWWTQEQVEYSQAAMAVSANDMINEALTDAFKPNRKGLVHVEINEVARPGMPDPLVEPDDMMLIAPPCHPWEPVKIPEDATEPYYCLICGSAYAV